MSAEELLDRIDVELKEKIYFAQQQSDFCGEHRFGMEQKALAYKVTAYNDVARMLRELRRELNIEKYN